GKLNTDENPNTAMKHRIMSIPTLLIFKDGEYVDRIIGASPKHALVQQIERYL
ncbi:MAG TPA: thioredoxin, partial [Thermoplasmata archaeon]|nr:thioredoxin [Thermoplasmata archaeon]